MPSLLLLRWRLFPLRDHRDPWRSRPKGVRDFKVRPTMRYTTRADRMSAGMRVSLHAKRNLSTVSKALLWVPLGVSVDTATCFFFSPLALASYYQLLPATASYCQLRTERRSSHLLKQNSSQAAQRRRHRRVVRPKLTPGTLHPSLVR